MRMLMGRFSTRMMPTSGSLVISSERKGVYGQSPIYGRTTLVGWCGGGRGLTPIPWRKRMGFLVFERCGRYQYEMLGCGEGALK